MSVVIEVALVYLVGLGVGIMYERQKSLPMRTRVVYALGATLFLALSLSLFLGR